MQSWCRVLKQIVGTLRSRQMHHHVFEIEGFNALQTWFGSSNYTSLKTTLQNATPNWKMKTSLESPRYNLPTTRTNERTSLSLQEVELDDGWFLVLHSVLETCTDHIIFMHKFNVSFVFHFYILNRLTSWIWTDPSTEELKFESHSKWNTYEGFNLEHWSWCTRSIILVAAPI